jgi:hypothetical protein
VTLSLELNGIVYSLKVKSVLREVVVTLRYTPRRHSLPCFHNTDEYTSLVEP